MNLNDVIEALVEERGLPREDIVEAICEGVLAAYSKKHPLATLSVSFNKKQGTPEIFAQKHVVANVSVEDQEISLRKAKAIVGSVELGDYIAVPLSENIGRIEVSAAKQIITGKIRDLEHRAIARDFASKQGTIISGVAHKRERAGIVVKLGDVMALLPTSNLIPGETIRLGSPVRCLLKDVFEAPKGGYQLILDRASADFVKNLLKIEIPEIFEGLVEIKKIVRVAGYKTKVLVSSNSKDIDPVGTCVGVDGVRIKPILKELNGEKIDLIEATNSVEKLIKDALKPAEIDKVELIGEKSAMVWLAQDQRSFAIGKMGRNIALASELCGIEIRLQEVSGEDKSQTPFEEQSK